MSKKEIEGTITLTIGVNIFVGKNASDTEIKKELYKKALELPYGCIAAYAITYIEA